MNKLLTTMFALAVASATVSVQAQKVTPNAENGSKKVQMCVGCHGIIGYQASFPEIHKVPKIAGQSASYITAALTEYKEGERKHPTMRAIADTLSEQDIADIAAYYSTLGLAEGDAPPATAAQPGEKVGALIARNADNNCTKCHGANFNTPNDGTVPKLAGQHADYLFVALKAYKAGTTYALVGRSSAVMGTQVKPFNNAELKELASYISSLPGELKTVPESRRHHAD